MKTRNYVVLLLIAFTFACNSDSEASFDAIDIVGEWRIIAIHTSTPQGPTIGSPEDEIVQITFLNEGGFLGTTSINSFGGQYTATNGMLSIEEFITTEALDTAFGQEFYSAINQSFNAETNFNDFELSMENTGLTLSFGDFGFLTLIKLD